MTVYAVEALELHHKLGGRRVTKYLPSNHQVFLDSPCSILDRTKTGRIIDECRGWCETNFYL